MSSALTTPSKESLSTNKESHLDQAVQLPPLLVQAVVGVPPPLLNVHQLRLQGGLGPGIGRQQQAPAGLHRQDVAALLPLQHALPQLEERRQGQWIQVNYGSLSRLTSLSLTGSLYTDSLTRSRSGDRLLSLNRWSDWSAAEEEASTWLFSCSPNACSCFRDCCTEAWSPRHACNSDVIRKRQFILLECEPGIQGLNSIFVL
ncbi:hypothetical protein EYF80_021288 [Liparis tanakae]|uniref:Uncharacterized protein n=1 Tax=Liparis tanakae TaxID=230148 RepID=A0A4Z2HU76_9TELE|nr:hypothetical protein EYF80_021288 [Liparis tanakae]